MKKNEILSLLAFSLFPLSSCAPSFEATDGAICASIYPVYALAKEIVGPEEILECITPFGMEPHENEPSACAMVSLTRSKAVLLQGDQWEPWADSLPKEVKQKTKTVTPDYEPLYVDGVKDPHVWTSPKIAKKELETIASALTDLDSKQATQYAKNLDNALQKMEELDQNFEFALSNLSRPYLVVSHASFGYLCRDYGLTQIPISGLSPDQEPSPRQIEAILEEIKTHRISTVFFEGRATPKIAESIATQTGCKVESLASLETISEEENEKEDYFSLMEKNLAKIKEALS